MKVASRVLAALIVISSASMAGATNLLWFTASGNNAQSTVQTQGAAGGGPAILKCNDSVAGTKCDWTVSMAFANNAGDSIIAWATDLASTDPAFKVVVVSGTFTAGSLTGWGNQVGAVRYNTGEQGHEILSNVNQNDTSPTFANQLNGGSGGLPMPAGGWILGTLRISKQKATPSLNTVDIIASIGDQGWSDSLANFPDIVAANNAAAGGNGPDTVLGPVIRIMNVPEPATLALLGLGSLALIRRRR